MRILPQNYDVRHWSLRCNYQMFSSDEDHGIEGPNVTDLVPFSSKLYCFEIYPLLRFLSLGLREMLTKLGTKPRDFTARILRANIIEQRIRNFYIST